MKEHRLIEEMVSALKLEFTRENEQKTANFVFLETAIDFFKTYADRCHHGKEEHILFLRLAEKTLSAEHAKIMRELTEEHSYARRTVEELAAAKDLFAQGEVDSPQEIENLLQKLADFYPKHIAKEDAQFFYPAMAYFTGEEQEKMMQDFWDFDKQLIHEKYQAIVENALAMVRRADLTKWKCTVCDYVYDPQKGDPQHNIKPGTGFKELPEGWVCPVCFAPKNAFKEGA
jgi:rubredoxin/hemerythrin-like domain-containing protein